MKRSQHELGDGHNNCRSRLRLRLPHQASSSRLNLSWTSLEFYNSIFQEHNPYHGQERLHDLIDYSNSTSTSSPESSKKQKPINFQASKITIGQWSYVEVYLNDIMVKFYPAKEKLIWEFLTREVFGTTQKTKIEIQWKDVLSVRAILDVSDETDFLEVELKKPPTFFVENTRQAGKATQWKQTDQDFTDNQSSIYRRHQVYFKAGILQQNLDKLVSGNKFWFDLFKGNFPLHESIYFDSGYGSNINNSLGQTLSFNNVDNANQNQLSQGTDPPGVGEDLLDMIMELCPDDGESCIACIWEVCRLHRLTQLRADDR